MGIVDYIYLGALAVALVLGLWKGFLKQAFALVGVFVVSICTTYLTPYPEQWLKGVIEADGTRSIVAMVVTFLVLSVVYSIVTKLISKAVDKLPMLGWLNRLLGAIFAIAVVYLIFSVLISLLVSTAEDFLPKIKELVADPLNESWIVNKVYGGAENPEKNWFGNWLIRVLQEKINSLLPTLPHPSDNPDIVGLLR